DLKQYADGRIFTGRQAKKLKLVDRLGNIQDAIKEAKKLAGLEGKTVMVIRLRKEEGLLQKMLDSKISTGELISFPRFYYLMSF
ncbi:MAG: signal peptide peptidase SppA, partial [Desulfobulbus sp.]